MGADLKPNLIGLSREELGGVFARLNVPEKKIRMRVGQVWHWLYEQGAQSFDDMTTLSKDLRAQLQDLYDIRRPEIVRQDVSSDGTVKWLLKFDDGEEAETVFIPEEDRGTLCVSSQVGCTLTCRFCHTGTQKLVRNLTPGEIIGQLLVARDYLLEWPGANPGANREERRMTNIVMMGMGEPLYNFDNVKTACHIMMDEAGIKLSRRRITLSTSGVVPMMERCGEEIGVNLAVSLHATRDPLRNELVPLNKKYPISDLMDACRNYPGASNARRITFEYVMLKDVNDSMADAKALVKLLQGVPAKINLIPFNAWPDAPYECSDWEQIESFGDYVNKAGYASPVRTPRGRDIMAACGQLKSDSVKKKKSEILAERAAQNLARPIAEPG